MLMIVAHHLVVHSGFMAKDGPMAIHSDSANTLFLYCFGMWGKTGINCFVLITGYFMVKSRITFRKFIKLLIWIYFYRILFYGIFCYFGYEVVSPLNLLKVFMPIWDVSIHFIDCFLVFWLTIPFWNILVSNMTKHQHLLLLLLLIGIYTALGSLPFFNVALNYVTWFGVLYLVSSYIRLYPLALFDKTSFWGWMSLISVMVSLTSVILIHKLKGYNEYFFVADSNKILAVIVAVTTFLWFKNLRISYSRWINMIGGSTFGVLLIHDNSIAMRHLLWKDLLACTSHYNMEVSMFVPYCLICVLVVFFTCCVIDRIRIKLVEEPFFRWYDMRKLIK